MNYLKDEPNLIINNYWWMYRVIEYSKKYNFTIKCHVNAHFQSPCISFSK